MYLILLVFFGTADFYVLLYTDIPWLPNIVYNIMSWILLPTAIITIVLIAAFLLSPAKRTTGIGEKNSDTATRSPGTGSLHFALQMLLISVLVLAGFGVVWVGLSSCSKLG